MVVKAQPVTLPTPAEPQEGFVGRIPVRNLWLLMLYASDLFRSGGIGGMGSETNLDEIPDLIAEILAHAVEQRLRLPLTTGYRRTAATLSRVRGRIDMLTTERHRLPARGLIACVFDELTIDTPRNRFVRGALASLSLLVSDQKLAHRCRCLARTLQTAGVSGLMPTHAEMSTERFGRHDASDQAMIEVAKLAMDLALPTEDVSGKQVLAPAREEMWVRQLYERAVGGLYEVALGGAGWEISCGTTLRWQIQSQSAGIERILPSMRTDVVLEHRVDNRRIVIDTKFTSLLTRGWYREESLRSGYLYQMYAYLRSQAGQGDAFADTASGMLLHPSIGADIDEEVVIQGHAIRFATVDLTARPAAIRSRLLDLVVSKL
jgi:5-methylcytosine-specific restriction enzyme subunit McrC